MKNTVELIAFAVLIVASAVAAEAALARIGRKAGSKKGPKRGRN